MLVQYFSHVITIFRLFPILTDWIMYPWCAMNRHMLLQLKNSWILKFQKEQSGLEVCGVLVEIGTFSTKTWQSLIIFNKKNVWPLVFQACNRELSWLKNNASAFDVKLQFMLIVWFVKQSNKCTRKTLLEKMYKYLEFLCFFYFHGNVPAL